MTRKALFSSLFVLFTLALPLLGRAETADERKARLEADLANIEQDIAAQKALLSAKQKESVSLERDVAILDAQISKAKLEIRARDISIQKLSSEVAKKNVQIGELAEKIEAEKEALSVLLRKTSEIDADSLPSLLLGKQALSDLFRDVDTFELLQNDLHALLDEVANTKADTEESKALLEEQKAKQLELRGIQEIEKRKIEQKEAERKKLLAQTKGQEKEYQKIVASREKDAATIRAALFSLAGSSAIPFGKALEYAEYASSKTGVRPALILGIITTESNLGENVGTGNWKTDMHPTRDVPVFEKITAKLGLDPDRQPVSKKAWYGWGGAMGPAQFIPSTWVLYEDKIAATVGVSVANPWIPLHAFTATALLLKDNGARTGNLASERLAALRYLAGWKNASNPDYAFYGDDVMGFATKYEAQIKILRGS